MRPRKGPAVTHGVGERVAAEDDGWAVVRRVAMPSGLRREQQRSQAKPGVDARKSKGSAVRGKWGWRGGGLLESAMARGLAVRRDRGLRRADDTRGRGAVAGGVQAGECRRRRSAGKKVAGAGGGERKHGRTKISVYVLDPMVEVFCTILKYWKVDKPKSTEDKNSDHVSGLGKMHDRCGLLWTHGWR